ncbi:acyl carrier protein [Pseudoalteromonas sp. MMG013]|uniref:Carrier domain-containing protein n=1 Tax=Pseudoalteromonas aurantia 208 TaxID=1314867 RepID=A0ABR9EMG0_9GAMM|nr:MULTISPECIES: acyl carrier protein [Pseudoalteromonas]MBE0370878.1 hypothetical protein [Pseudoalteromonas aurantia 208]MBQ4844637.1 acyl carrier protein [Pseudoalteromonas sp. MMG005]MBQ4850422.1 acyl carrier protein [Pseudoalteromonas sp. MMG012]MBQ4863677.1 acyl carrier protein [Pseudoalteromonas sp. MMG013]
MLNPSVETVSAKLCHFIATSYLDDDEQVAPDTPIIKLNILDSASIFDVVEFIHREFALRLPVIDIHPDNFATVAVLSKVVEHHSNKEAAL